MSDAPTRRRSGAAFVAAGILLSRVFGLVRGRLLGHFLGTGSAADALGAAIKIPNFLQNLFGEGVLSASFIPVYARLIAEDDEVEAGRVAGAIGALLVAASAVLVALGIIVAPIAIPLIAPGFTGAKRELTTLLVQVMFPGVGLLVLSAWSLGILNSHRKYFLSYASPVAMNLVMIGALMWFGPEVHNRTDGAAHLAFTVAWASVVGSLAQLAVQLPTVWRIERHLRFRLKTDGQHVRGVLTSFVPVFLGRGVVQLSAYVDGVLASLVVSGSVAILGYAQVITMLPVSLFGMSVSVAELSEMSRLSGGDNELSANLQTRLQDGLRRIAFYVIPSAMAFLLLGDVIGGALYQSGEFGRGDVMWLWGVLAGSAVGLLAGTLGRLYASTLYALRDTRTPLKFAVIRVVLTTIFGYVAALRLPAWLGLGPHWAVAGLTASAGVAAWVEFYLLRRSVAKRVGYPVLGGRYVATLWGCAAIAATPAWGLKVTVGPERPLLLGLVALVTYGGMYLALAAWAGVDEVGNIRGRLRSLLGHR